MPVVILRLAFIFSVLLAPSFINSAESPEQEAALAEADRLNQEANRLSDAAKFSEAELLYKRALAIYEKALGPENPSVAFSLNGLGLLYLVQGRYLEAELVLKRALAIRDKALGAEHPNIAVSLNNLGELYQHLGRYAEAELLYRRALTIDEKAFGPEHRNVAARLSNLATIYQAQSRYAEAESLHKRALAIIEKALGPEDPSVTTSLNNLAALYHLQRRYAEAELLYKRRLAIDEKIWGPEHNKVSLVLNNLALLYQAQGQYAQAEPLYRRSLAIREKVLGLEHPDVAVSLNNLASMFGTQGNHMPARPLYERARRIQLTVARTNVDLDEASLRGLLSSAQSELGHYARTLAVIARDPKLDDKPGSAQRDAFLVVEQARAGAAQGALAKSSARVASGDPATAQLARQVQDLRNRREATVKLLTQEYGRPIAQRNDELVKTLQQESQKLDRELSSAVEKLNKAFPKFAELSSPEPIDLPSVQQMLRPDEALISYFTLDDRLLIWLVRKGKDPVYRDTEIKKADLNKLVSRVRVSLDQSQNPALRGSLTPFDVAGAHELYKLLLAPVEEHLAGVKHLIIVPDEVLLPLPFGALITRAEGEPYQSLSQFYSRRGRLTPLDQSLPKYAKLSWLVKDYAITVLPSATSLRALRQIPRTKQKDTELLIAFGDPVLEGKGAQRGGAMLASRGITIPVEEIRKMNRLPGTRQELIAVASALGASPNKSLYLDRQATEPMVTKLNSSGRLAKAEVVAFSTHGLISGELKGLKEPALVLTPPKTPTEDDDGLLGLEDILKLKLDSADWVILSACNTAAADGSGEGLSGLTRAFFFAGAKSLLVSHWSVEDRATQALMTEVFQRYARDKTTPRSEALRQGMLALIEKAKGNTAYFAHPFAWAPFFLVGEGSK